jgi:CHAT domain-containing protein
MPMRKGCCVCWMALCLLVSGLAAAQLPSETPQAAEARLVQAAEAAVAQHGELSPEHFVALGALADHHYFLQNNAEWVALMQRLVDLRIRAHGPDHLWVARAWLSLGAAHMSNSEPALALAPLQRALAIREQQLGPEHVDVAFALTNLGGVYMQLARYAEARVALERALALREKLLGPDHLFVSWTLAFLGQVHMAVGDPARALPLFRRELAIRERQSAATRHGSLDRLVAESLANVASAQRALGDVDGARASLRRDLELATRNDGAAGRTLRPSLNDNGLLALSMGEYGEALVLLQRALDMARQIDGPAHRNVGHQLSGLGLLLHRAGDATRAVPMHRQAVSIDQAALGAAHPLVALRQRRLAAALADLGQLDEARQQLQAARQITAQSQPADHPELADTDIELGRVARLAGDLAAARRHLDAALALLLRRQGAGQAAGTAALAGVLLEQGDLALTGNTAAERRPTETLRLATEALPLALAGRSPDLQARALDLLGSASEALGQSGAGLFWRKQAVNRIQSLRTGASQAPADFQRRFLASRRASFVQLADRLAAAGRVAEAQTVLAMLKEDELHESIQRDVPQDPRSTRVGFSGPAETRADVAYRRVVDRLAALSAQRSQVQARVLLGELAADAEEALGMAQQWADAVTQWQSLVAGTALSLPDPSAAGPRASGTAKPDPALRQMLAQVGPRTALLHYVITPQGLLIMLSTDQRQRVWQLPVAPAQLNREVAALRRAIQQREAFLPLAQQLHQRLLAPLAGELKAAGVQTLLLSLDGSLRYLPFAVLHDGQRFLVQRHALAIYNPAAAALVARAPSPRWTVTAMGATRGSDTLAPLPAVRTELERLRTGRLPTAVYQDERFTKQRLQLALDGGDPVLHLASHFSFRPGALADSYLLLGDGSRLTLQDVRRRQLSFEGIELLTLSACDTALGGGLDENGSEVESFAALAQRQGAHAVLATLWPVEDGGSADFMGRFYDGPPGAATQRRQPKAQALHAAQRAFIEGRVRLSGKNGDAAHPYFWAAYVLMGNPR